MRLKELPKEILPREKAMRYGIESLDDKELLALLLQSGTKNFSVLMIAETILQKAGGLTGLWRLNYHVLKQVKGISHIKALQILGLVEISKRINDIGYNLDHLCLDELCIVKEYIRKKIGQCNNEQVLVLFLDNSLHLIADRILFRGETNKITLSLNLILKLALELEASKIILAHNHPSNWVLPSIQDIELTKRLAQACELIGIRLIDHIIVSSQDSYSMLENKEDLVNKE